MTETILEFLERPLPALRADAARLRTEVRRHMHTLRDVLEGRVAVGVEGRGGKDVDEAERAGLYVDRRYALFARDAASAAPVVAFLAAGGSYGAEFSRLVGYTPDEIETFERFLAATRALLLREVGPLTRAQVEAVRRLTRLPRDERDWSLHPNTGGALVTRGLADVETSRYAGRFGRAGAESQRARRRHYVEAGYRLTDRGRMWWGAHHALEQARRAPKANRGVDDPGVPRPSPTHPYFAFAAGLPPLYHRTQAGAEGAVTEALRRARGRIARGMVGMTTWADGARTSRTLAAFDFDGGGVTRVELADLSKPNGRRRGNATEHLLLWHPKLAAQSPFERHAALLGMQEDWYRDLVDEELLERLWQGERYVVERAILDYGTAAGSEGAGDVRMALDALSKGPESFDALWAKARVERDAPTRQRLLLLTVRNVDLTDTARRALLNRVRRKTARPSLSHR